MRLYFMMLLIFTAVYSQVSPFGSKKGDCPPTTGSRAVTCEMHCLFDMHCGGSQKCCPTSCGGAYCVKPVMEKLRPTIKEKPGYCPDPESLPWVCSSRCSTDSDCRSDKKCCSSGCGGKGCYKPVVVEIPEEREDFFESKNIEDLF